MNNFRNSIRALNVPTSVSVKKRPLKENVNINRFHFARVSKLSNYKCRACGVPIRSTSIRRMVLCPVCGAANEMT